MGVLVNTECFLLNRGSFESKKVIIDAGPSVGRNVTVNFRSCHSQEGYLGRSHKCSAVTPRKVSSEVSHAHAPPLRCYKIEDDLHQLDG
jgi:hypothetical protein